MDTPHPHTIIENNFPGVIISDHNVKPKLKTQVGFMINISLFCLSLYQYYDVVMIDELMKLFTETNGPYTHGIIFQVPNVQKNMIRYRIEYDTTKSVGNGLGFGDQCTEISVCVCVDGHQSVYLA